MSPEQTRGVQLDERTDIWSLGVVLYEVVTGHAPFTGDTSKEVMSSILEMESPPLMRHDAHAPAELQQILNKTLCKDCTQRYRSAQELLHALKGLRRKLEVEAELKRSIAAGSWLYRKRVLAGLVLGLLVALLAAAVPLYWHRNRAISSPSEKSIVVLPFENASNDPNAEYLSEGISEALINSLSELQRLKVIARSTAFHYKGKDIDPRRVGRELQVGAVLTGRVRQAQDALSVQVDLVDAATGAQLWGEEYHRKISDVIAVKQAIAREVTEKLRLKLSGEEQRRLAKDDGTNTEAYRFYLRGRYFWNKRTPGGIKQAITEFQQAIERDPNFALGYVGLADCYTGLTFYNFAAPHEAMPKAKASATKAVLLDDTVAEAHASLGHILMNYDWDWPRADKEFKRSIELKPDYATAHQWYAIHYLTATGRLEEAVQEMRKALELEPASLVMNTFMGATLYYAGRYDEAIDQCRRTVEMDPNFAVAHWHLGLAYEEKQAFDAAIEEFQTAISLSQSSPLMKAALGHAYAKSQRADEANKILDELNELSKQQYVSPLELARIYVALGNDDKAFQSLEKAYAEHSFHLVNLNVSPQFKSVRSDPRFQNLVQRLGLSGSASNAVRPEKSIAVLPFENLSNDREDAAFADGVQDDILTKLAKIADLKVISRISVMQYRGKQNTREIGDALRVSHVLEGSVRKTGAWLHINARLIDTRTDTHFWVEQYDRDLKDLFAVQSEIAQKVAESLRAKILPAERLAIQRPPTAHIAAFDLYSRAKNLVLAWNSSTTEKGYLLQAADLLNQAVAHDPSFFQAHCQLAWTHDQLYFFRMDRTPERLALAEAAIESAFQLRPDSGEAHLARADHLYYGYLDYDGALAELETARKTLSNDPRLFELKAYIERRRASGNQEEALRNLERAVELDPRNVLLLQQTARGYDSLRRYANEEAILDRALAVKPNDVYLRGWRAFVELDWKADTQPLHQLIDSVRATNPATIPDIGDRWLTCSLAERDAAAAANALAAQGERSFGNELLKYSPHFMQGIIAQMTKDDANARAAFTLARAEQEKLVRGEPENAGALSVLGLIDAALGRKEEALHEGRRAIELLPAEKDAINGTRLIVGLARIAAWVGDNELACEQLATAIRLPGRTVTYGQLKLMPWWDPLRGDPCFEQIVASLAPKGN
jgi:TolB-like protein/Tfp pilus assembly protein PilF